MVILSLFLRTK